MLSRRGFSQVFVAGLGAAASERLLSTKPASAQEAEVGDSGLYTQDWFLDSFLELKDDQEEAAAEGKHFAVLWEQRGCAYCRELHRVNFARPDIRGYVQENFTILQLDLWGSRKVTDFDGEILEERAMARKWAVNFTPTIMFLPLESAEIAGRPANHSEVMRMPGYFKPFHFISMFEFVREAHYKNMGFQRYLQDKFAQYEAQGIDPDVW
jgi:thioredoxin-related protein